MGTNEEYLDSLLKNSLNAIDDGNSGMERIAGLHKQNQEPDDLFAEPISDEPMDLFAEPISDEPMDLFAEPISDEPMDLFAEPISDEPMELFAEPISDEPMDLFAEPISDEPIDLFAEMQPEVVGGELSEDTAEFVPFEEQAGIEELVADFGSEFIDTGDELILIKDTDEEPLENQTIILEDEEPGFSEGMTEISFSSEDNEDINDELTDIIAEADTIEENQADAFDINAFADWANGAQEEIPIPIVPSPQDYSQSDMFSDDNGKKKKRFKKEKVKKEKVKKEKVKKEKVKKEKVKKEKKTKKAEETVIPETMNMAEVPEMPLEDFGFSSDSNDIPESMFATDIESMFQSESDFATEQDIESILLGDADELASIPEKNSSKKDGFFARMSEALFAEDEDEPEEDKKNKEKKSKKDKKGKKEGNAEPELSEDDLEEEQQKGKKKKEKVKKEKKPKKEKVETPKEKSNISLKRCLPIICICCGIGIILIVLALVVPNVLQMKKARAAYYNQNYEEAYEALSGRDLNESDKILYRKAEIMMLMDTKVSDYEIHSYLGQKMEALDDIFIGVDRYYKNYNEIVELNILEDANVIFKKLLEIANSKYNLSEEEIQKVLGYKDPVTYTKILDSILKGNGIDIFTTVIPDEPVDSNNNKENINNLEDVMDEEQDIIDQMADYLEGQGT